jgi:hypothetical protein
MIDSWGCNGQPAKAIFKLIELPFPITDSIQSSAFKAVARFRMFTKP